MDEKKMRQILEDMKGLTYLEWQKLKMSIDAVYNSEASKLNKKIQLTDTEQVIRELRNYSSTI